MLFILNGLNLPLVMAQFEPQAGLAGSSAIHKDSSAIVAWASACNVVRGWQYLGDTSLGKATVGDEAAATGAAGNGVLSLGDGGSATLTFAKSIRNGPGPDFAVFENGFMVDSLAFLELAYVEVSSDGSHFVRFPAICNNDTSSQIINGQGMNASRIHNLAGKYISMYGTPFDLDIFATLSSIDINHITHIRVIDVVGSIQASYANRDSRGVIINDPWPTPFPSSGFDLDAIGVLHQNDGTGSDDIQALVQPALYPNPLVQGQTLHVDFTERVLSLELVDMAGHKIETEPLSELLDQPVPLPLLGTGLYVVIIRTAGELYFQKLLIR